MNTYEPGTILYHKYCGGSIKKKRVHQVNITLSENANPLIKYILVDAQAPVNGNNTIHSEVVFGAELKNISDTLDKLI